MHVERNGLAHHQQNLSTILAHGGFGQTQLRVCNEATKDDDREENLSETVERRNLKREAKDQTGDSTCSALLSGISQRSLSFLVTLWGRPR